MSAWDETDRDAFATSLRRAGAGDETIATTVATAERVLDVSGPLRGLLPRHVDEAIERAVWRGEGGDEQARIREAGQALLRFVRDDPPRRRLRDVRGDDDAPIDLAPDPRIARRSTRPARRESLPPMRYEATRGGAPPGKCPACAGTLRPTGARTMRRSLALGGAVAVAMILSLHARVGWAGSVALASGLVTVATGLGAALAAHVCERCERRVGARHLDDDGRRGLAALRARAAVASLVAMLIAMGAGMIAVALAR